MLNLGHVSYLYIELSKEIVVEVSGLPKELNIPGTRFVNVHNPKTGNTIEFQFNKTETVGSDGDLEISGWQYVISKSSLSQYPNLAGLKLAVLND